MRTLARAMLPLFVLACLLPASASAQDPSAGYQASLPETVSGTNPSPASGTEAEETSGSSAPAEAAPAPAQPVAAPSVTTNTLPFTGFQIAAMIAAGLALLGLGMALRRVSGPALPGT